jgi:putative PIN family toxin of toxin-antitoxin system
MLPLRLVLDTNIVISAAIKPEGLQRTVLLLALTKPAQFYVTRPILEEYRDILARPELKIRRGLQQQFLQLIKNRSRLVKPSRLPQLTADSDDNMFLECADAAGADYLITGNPHHFPRSWKNVKVVTSREFVTLVVPHLLS